MTRMGVLENRRIAFAMAASHCNMDRALRAMAQVVAAGAEVIPVLSHSLKTTATRFGKPEDWIEQARAISGREPLTTIPEVEPFGPRREVDCTVVCPCTGNTLARLANAINDSPVCMAVKATLRNGRPVVLAITSNDILGLNAKNLGILLAAKGVYFVPFGQDNPVTKPTSVDARIEEYLVPTIAAALEGHQLQPLLLGPPQISP